MSTSKRPKRLKTKHEAATTLRDVVKERNVNKVQELLKQGVDPNGEEPRDYRESLVDFAIKQHEKVIAKLLVEYGANVESATIKYIFKYGYHLNELLPHIIEHSKSVKVLQEIFYHLLEQNERVLESTQDLVFKLSVDRGLPIDDFIEGVTRIVYFPDEDDEDELEEDVYTPLQLCTKNDKVDFVSELLERGANVNKKTKNGIPPLYLAIMHCNNKSIVDILLLLLRKGVHVNAVSKHGKTALHYACALFSRMPEVINLLLDHGADLNILDNRGNSPLEFAFEHSVQQILVKQLVMTSFEGRIVCPENLELLRKDCGLQKHFDECSSELRTMQGTKFYNDFTLYDVVKMRKQRRKLIYLMNNKDFTVGFEAHCKKLTKFKYYGCDVRDIFSQNLERSAIVQAEEDNIKLTFKNYKYKLPDLVVRKIAYFLNEDLFFD